MIRFKQACIACFFCLYDGDVYDRDGIHIFLQKKSEKVKIRHIKSEDK